VSDLTQYKKSQALARLATDTLQTPVPLPKGPPAQGAAGEQIMDESDQHNI